VPFSLPGRLLADTRPLRELPAYRRFWIGTTISSAGGAMTSFAVALQVFRITHSPAAVGAIGLFLAVPTIVVGLVGGSVADAVDRRRLVLVTSNGLAGVSVLFAVQAFAGSTQVWLLYLLVGVQSLLASVDGPARRTLTPRIVTAERLPAAVALNQLSFQVVMVVGPALAGLVAATGGLRWCYAVDVVSFAAALYGVARLPALPPLEDIGRPGLAAVVEGIRYIGRSRVLVGAFLADLDAMVLAMPFALLPAVNADRFGGHAGTLGLLAAAPGVGGLVGSTLSGPLGHVARRGRAMLVAVAVWGAAVTVFGLAGGLAITLVALAVAGAADTTSVVLRATMVQQVTPDRYRGRVTAADYVVGAGGPQLGNLRAGVVGSLTSPGFSAAAGGIAAMLGAAVIALAVPALARHRIDPGEGPSTGSPGVA
jgi:MFS family permease